MALVGAAMKKKHMKTKSSPLPTRAKLKAKASLCWTCANRRKHDKEPWKLNFHDRCNWYAGYAACLDWLLAITKPKRK